MTVGRDSAVSGWPILGWTSLGIAAMVAAIFAAAGTEEAGLRMAVRATARTSVTFFLLAFVASSLRRVWPSPATRWLLANRRQVGLSFAVSHFTHLALLLALAGWSLATFVEMSDTLAVVFGGLAYVFIAAMTVTSFDRTAAWLGPRAWKRLHTVGAYYIWFIFAQSYIPRAFVEPSTYAPFALVVVAALMLRLAVPALARRGARAETRVQAVKL